METNNRLDTTGTLSDLWFKIIVLWAEELSKEQIGNQFGFGEKWADKQLCLIYKKLNVHTRHGCIDKAWLLGIFTHQNRSIPLQMP